MRATLISSLKNILKDSNLFKVVRKLPTKIEKERTLPIAWVNLGNETFTPDSVNKIRNFRYINLEVLVGVRQMTDEDLLNPLVDSTLQLLADNYTLGGNAINLTPTTILTDNGYLYPYAMASLRFKILVR